MPNGYDTFKIYHAIDLHFSTDSYDFIKYKGKTNVTPNMWYRRQDKYHFEVLGSKYKPDQIIGIFVSYFTQNIHVKKPYGAELTQWARDGYPKWLADVHSMPKKFEEDLFLIKQRGGKKLNKLFIAPDGQLPPFVEMIVNKDINIASAIILTDIVKEMGGMLEQCTDDIMWPSVKSQMNKYRPFLNYDKAKYVNIIKTTFNKTVDKKLKNS